MHISTPWKLGGQVLTAYLSAYNEKLCLEHGLEAYDGYESLHFPSESSVSCDKIWNPHAKYVHHIIIVKKPWHYVMVMFSTYAEFLFHFILLIGVGDVRNMMSSYLKIFLWFTTCIAV